MGIIVVLILAYVVSCFINKRKKTIAAAADSTDKAEAVAWI
ncbi:hypothetical protein [Bifidobacterium sp. ESL0819]